MNCALCGSNSNKVIYNYTRFEKNNILQCDECGLVFLEIKQSRKQIEYSYSTDGYRNRGDSLALTPDQLFLDPVARQDARKRADWIKLVCGDLADKRILEIGSASGNLLDTLRRSGVSDIQGIELSWEFSEHARNLGFTVHSRPFEELRLKGRFDIIAMFHTLEHILDPVSLTKSIYASLKPGGKFMGEVPNQDDWRISLFDCDVVKRFHYESSHYYYYSPLTLYALLHKGGFYAKNIKLSTVERYNSLVQLSRILGGVYSDQERDKIMMHDIFATPDEDLRLEKIGKEMEFNQLFEVGVNSDLRGNCLRWEATR